MSSRPFHFHLQLTLSAATVNQGADVTQFTFPGSMCLRCQKYWPRLSLRLSSNLIAQLRIVNSIRTTYQNRPAEVRVILLDLLGISHKYTYTMNTNYSNAREGKFTDLQVRFWVLNVWSPRVSSIIKHSSTRQKVNSMEPLIRLPTAQNNIANLALTSLSLSKTNVTTVLSKEPDANFFPSQFHATE
jgi:hypothetical protein